MASVPHVIVVKVKPKWWLKFALDFLMRAIKFAIDHGFVAET